MARAYAPLLAPHGLTYLQYLVLVILWEGEEVSVGGLGERLFLNSATLTPVLKRLEGTGLLTRRRGTADEREVLVSLTARGRSLQPTMSDVPDGFFAKAALSESALVTLRTKLHALRRNLTRDAVR